ncbi:MAG: transglycosylase domain-containing protein [Micropruina sp.]|uniref:transglycosylase domain-containing protein n=1 Tax=Micropruina sp. TaxID=2737536 RepID=UPI0039E2A37C
MRLGKRLYSLVMFLVVSVLGGLLVAGLVVPVAGMGAEVGKATAVTMDSLPAELATPPQAQRSSVLMADGKTLVNFYDEYRQYVKLDKIAPIMRKAQVAIEDHRFYEHGALDLQGTMRALVSTVRGNTQGASTLTQQYVKMAQISAAAARGDAEGVQKAQENTLTRKIQELRYAMALEKKYTKDQILEFYLNIAYYGDGAYGVEAAAMNYFGVHASKLNLQQAAMLAGMVRNPVGTNPRTPGLELVTLQRRNDVLDRMAQKDVAVITPQDAAAAKAKPLGLVKAKSKLHGCGNSEFPFLCDYVRRTLLKSPSLGASEEDRENTLYRGGLTVRTIIDPKVQRKAEKSIHNFVDPRDPLDVVNVMIQPGTGLIVSMAQNRNKMGTKKSQTYWNYAVGNKMGGAGGYQGGSTFKLFVAAAALKNGLGAYGTIKVPGSMNIQGMRFQSCQGPFNFPTRHYVKGRAGTFNLFTGTTNSVNGYFTALESAAGLCDSTKMAQALGLEMAVDPKGDLLTRTYSNYPAFTLGAVEVTPLSLVNAYATVAARGIHCDPIIVKSIKAADGSTLEAPSANCKRVLDEGIADALSKIFQGPFRSGTATAARIPGYTLAGKTGTVADNKAIWTVGFTRNLAGGGMISYSSEKRFKKYWSGYRARVYIQGAYMKYSHRKIKGQSGPEAGRYIFKPPFAMALKNYDRKAFVEPPYGILAGRKVDVPGCSGVYNCKAVLANAGFGSYTDYVASNAPKGTFLGISPAGVAVRGTSIRILISSGPVKKPDPKPDPKPSDKPTSKPSEKPKTDPTPPKKK